MPHHLIIGRVFFAKPKALVRGCRFGDLLDLGLCRVDNDLFGCRCHEANDEGGAYTYGNCLNLVLGYLVDILGRQSLGLLGGGGSNDRLLDDLNLEGMLLEHDRSFLLSGLIISDVGSANFQKNIVLVKHKGRVRVISSHTPLASWTVDRV